MAEQEGHMAEIKHKDLPPEDVNVEQDEETRQYMAECPYCPFVADPAPKVDEARVKLFLHLLDEQKKELAAVE